MCSMDKVSHVESKNNLNDLSKITIKNKTNNRSNDDTKSGNVAYIPFFSLFRFASIMDKVYIFFALLLSVVCGCSLPISTLIFSTLLQAMVDYGKSVVAGAPENEAFLQSARNFAIYNCILGVAIIIVSYIATVLMNIAAYNQVYRIRQKYLKAALNQEFAYYDVNQMGDVAAKLTNDLMKVEDGIGEKFANFIFFQACLFSSVIMALIKGWKLALLCLISFPITFIPVILAGLLSSRLSKKEAEASSKAGAIAEEVLSSIRTVYAFSGQKKEEERYEKYLLQASAINISKAVYNGLSMGFVSFCMFGSYAMSFWFGYKLMVEEPETYDVSTMIAVFFGVLMGTEQFHMSTILMEVFGVARGAAVQIFNLIEHVPTIDPLTNRGITPAHVEGNIELKNIFFHYPSRPDVTVLNGVSMNIEKGQSVALVGHSGSGKSTVIQLISRYYDVVDGSLCVDSNDVRDLSVRWLRAQIGLVSQEPLLFNTTVRENIRYGREDATDEEIVAVAKQANAHQFILKLPNDYETLVGERGTLLSGGQKQRIAIARALIRNPNILLLDEATSALDTTSEAIVQEALDKAQKGRTTIIVAHRLSTIQNVDIIYVFKSGRIVESGNHDSLMDKKGQYYDMVMVQSSPGDQEKTDKSQVFARKMSVKSEPDEDECVNIKNEETQVTAVSEEVSFWRVLRLSAPEWKSATTASLCSLLRGFALPLFAIVLGDFLGMLSNPNTDEVRAKVITYAITFVVIGVITGVFDFLMVYFYGIAGEYLTTRLRMLMFKNLLQQEISYFDNKSNSTGALCARLSGEAAAVQGATGQRIGTVLHAVGTFLFSIIVSVYYQWQVGLVSLSCIPVMAVLLYKEAKMLSDDSHGSTKAIEDSSKLAVEVVTNVRTVASLGREETFLKEYAKQLLPAVNKAKRDAHWRGLVFGFSRGIYSFIYTTALYYGSILMLYNQVDYSHVLKSAEALIIGVMFTAQAFAFAPNFQKGISAAGRIMVILNKQSKITDPEKPTVENFKGSGNSSLNKIAFKYQTRPMVQVLKDLSLEIPRGKTIALVGASGCGKSTVIQLLQRYYDPDSGTVTQDGIPLPQLRLADLRQTIGFVQQEPILFDRTIAENIAYGDNTRNHSMEEIIEVAKQANIHNFIASLPMGYDTNIGSRGTQLSGGQKQRVAIARALIRRPKMLILDEATSALDTESEKVVQEALDAAKAGRTCVIIAHRLSTVRDADCICVLQNGQVAEQGTHAQLINLQGLYYNLNRRRNL